MEKEIVSNAHWEKRPDGDWNLVFDMTEPEATELQKILKENNVTFEEVLRAWVDHKKKELDWGKSVE